MLLQTREIVGGIPAEPPIGGAFWTVIVPVLLLLLAAICTALLYRKFSDK